MSGTLTAIRWNLFKGLSWLGWKVCPEPYRSEIQFVMPTWQRVREARLIRSQAPEAAGKDGGTT